MQLLQLVDVRVEEASRPLHDEVAALMLLLARAGDSLEPSRSLLWLRKNIYMVVSLLVAVLHIATACL
jgi:hypothetical protein